MQAQKGATLLLTLIFTLLITLAAVSASQFSRQNLAISGNYIAKERATLLAEETLIEVQERLQNMDIVHGCEDGDSDCFVNKFADDCTNGLCFNGTYVSDGTNTSCDLNDAASDIYEQQSTYWDEAVSVGNAKYLVEFRCYVLAPGVDPDTSIAIPDANAWNALFRINVLADQDDARVLIQHDYLSEGVFIPGVKGMFSVNKKANIYNGASITAYYCKFCNTTHLAGQVNADPTQFVFDPDTIPSFAFGQDISHWTDVQGTYVDTGAPTPNNIGGALGAPVPSGTPGGLLDYMGCHTNTCTDEHLNEAEQISQLSGNDYFASYFTTKNRDDIYNHANATKIPAADYFTTDFSALNATADNPKIVVVEGSLTIDGTNTLPNRHQDDLENIIVIVKGNLNVSNTSYRERIGLLYVEGDFNWSGSYDLQGVVAVEGSATINSSIALRPQKDPADLVKKLDIEQDSVWSSASWQALTPDF